MRTRVRRHGRVVVALVVAGSAFGIASAVQADIPDGNVVNACYGKAGTPQKGQLRVRDASQGEQCRSTETPISWNAAGTSGPTGPTGPSGAAGPTSLTNGGITGLTEVLTDLVTHTVTAGEAGLTILTAPVELFDLNGTIGGATRASCLFERNGTLFGIQSDMVVSDDGSVFPGDTASATMLERQTLATGDVVGVACIASSGDGGEGTVTGKLLLERVTS